LPFAILFWRSRKRRLPNQDPRSGVSVANRGSTSDDRTNDYCQIKIGAVRRYPQGADALDLNSAILSAALTHSTRFGDSSAALTRSTRFGDSSATLTRSTRFGDPSAA